MQRDEVLAIVRANQEQLQQLGVKSLELFGSVARDRAKPDSDVDFLVDFSRPVGAKHSGNNLSVKLEIFYPNASPVLFQQALFRDFLPVNLALPYLWS